jgi:Arc/MetJ-type ribon-helix-helix transcriptional regulator
MATLSIELPDSMLEFVDREIRAGRFKDRSTLVQRLIGAAMQGAPVLAPDQIKRFEPLILEALDEEERGEVSEWTPGDARKMLDEIMERRKGNGRQ